MSTAEILRARALRLAEPPPARSAERAARPVLSFEFGTDVYALDLRHVGEVLALRSLTPLPGMPPVYRGVTYVRGRILPVIDARRLLALDDREPSAASRLVRIAVDRLDLGLLVDGQVAVASLPVDAWQNPFFERPGNGIDLVEGITADRIAVINAHRLAADARIRVPPRPPDPGQHLS
ncbi:MAG: chemotaxis protein CheW [Lautropia sp.]